MLDKQGFIDAHKLKEFFRTHKHDHIFCSKMTRAIQTATIISDGRKDHQPIPVEGLEPWDVGFITGKDKVKYGPVLQQFIDNPKLIPEGGESKEAFYERLFPVLGEAMELGLKEKLPPVLVAHSSVIHSLLHLLYGNNHPPLSVKPGGVVEVFLDKDGTFDARPVFKEGRDDSSFVKES